MGYFSDQIITDAGMKMLADSVTNGTKITFTRLDVGDGIYTITDIAGMKQQTALKSKRAAAPVNSIHTSEDGIRIGSAISNEGLSSGYYIREIGVYASFPDGEETLVAVSISTAATASYLPAFDERVIEIPIMNHIAYSGDGNFTIEYRSDVYTSLEDFKELCDAVDVMDNNKVDKEDGMGLSQENFTSALKKKLEGVDEGANKYDHPTHTAYKNGLYKVTVDEEGHVTDASEVEKEDITTLGIPGQDTTYEPATQSKAGLLSAGDKKKLDSMGDNVKQDIANAVNGIKVGGRNLLLNSDFSRGETKCWQTSSRASIVKEGRNGSYCFKQVGALNNTCTSNNLLYNDGRSWIETSPGEVFTFSGWYKVKDYVAGTTNNFVRPYVEYRKPNQEWISDTSIMDIKADATDWTYVTASFKVPENLDIKYLGFSLFARDYTGTVWWDEVKLERGNKVNDWTPAPEDVEYEIENVRKEITVNLLKPTLATTTQNGVICTNNGDGTYTLNGIASETVFLNLQEKFSFNKGVAYKLLGWGSAPYRRGNIGIYISRHSVDTSKQDIFDEGGKGGLFTPESNEKYNISLVVIKDTVLTNNVIKPMLTTNLDATYDDFVPYTGDTGKLNGDVAEIKNKLSSVEDGANKTTVDSALSSTSTNPVQNKVVKAALDGKAKSTHTHSGISTVGDKRTTATTPEDYKNDIIFQGIKTKDAINIGGVSSSGYAYLIGMRGWHDETGGHAHEYAFTDQGVFHRMSVSSSTWGSWEKMISTSNFSTYGVPKTGGTFTGKVRQLITSAGDGDGSYTIDVDDDNKAGMYVCGQLDGGLRIGTASTENDPYFPIYVGNYIDMLFDLTAENRLITLLDVDGNTQFPGCVTANNGFKGNLTGQADKALKDANGNIISSTYITKSDPIYSGKFYKSDNTVNRYAQNAVAIGGSKNTIDNTAESSIIGGVSQGIKSNKCAIVGGQLNNIYANANYSAIMGGSGNRLGDSGESIHGIILGGQNNSIGGTTTTAAGKCDYSTIINGYNNTIQGVAADTYMGVIVGDGNTIKNSSKTFIGGSTNTSKDNEGLNVIFGNNNEANKGNHFIIGHHNKKGTMGEPKTSGATGGSLLTIGNGTPSAKNNAFRFDDYGRAFGLTWNTSGADYAEYFEWVDGNPDGEDRVGFFVTLDGGKIKIANSSDDYILGIVSGAPAVLGNSDEQWMGRYVLDEFGRRVMHDIEEVVEKTIPYIETITTTNEDGEEVTEEIVKERVEKETIHTKAPVEVSDYDPEAEYIPRSDRPEWATVGMLGVLTVYDDGTCEKNGFCKVASGGIATAAEFAEGSYQSPVYRVIDRVTENLIKVLFR